MTCRTGKVINNGLKERGASLIEVVVTLAVISFGVLAVLSLQGEFSTQSGHNKARAEAIALAQARIEEMRNLTNRISDASEFNTPYLAGYAGTETALKGVNATFDRSTSVTPTTSATEVAVTVSWTDRSNTSRSVQLSSQFAWASPRAPGDIAREPKPSLYTPPTGKANPGEGSLPEDVDPDLLSEQDDNLRFYMDGADLKLVDEDGNIVLTLEEGCKDADSVEACYGFVTINGRVYIDTETQKNLEPGQVAVKSSDTTYCTRFYEVDDSVKTIGNTDTDALSTTPDGDYDYFDYRCYASYGWHGNIGIILEGGNQLTDKICQGDPLAIANNGWEEPVIAARRIYRGMYYKPDSSTDSGKVESDGIPLYWSVGVAAGEELGYEVTYEDDDEIKTPMHNFIVSSMDAGATTGDHCISLGVMVRPDSDVDRDGIPGDLFIRVPDDFYCLNPHVDATSLDLSQYAIDDNCPFDPSGPPIAHYIIAGELSGSATIDTSDGPGNCRLTDGEYRCDLYDWGDGWNGFLQVNTDLATTVCNYDRYFEGGVMGNTEGPDFSCAQGASSVVRGKITLLNNAEVSEMAIRQQREFVVTNDQGESITEIRQFSRPCQVDPLSGSFSCVTANLGECGEGESGGDSCIVHQDWSARIEVAGPDYVCQTADGQGLFNIDDFTPGMLYVQDVIVAEREQGCPR